MKKLIKFLIILIIIIVLVIIYARYIGTKGLKVHEYKVESSTISEAYHGLKIVHLSDIHYGSTVLEKELSNIVDKVNLLKPDIVVLTGDLIDNRLSYDKDIIVKYLSKINVNIGKYAINGNHDVLEDYKNILNESNFIYLDNTYELIYNDIKPIIISGISSSLGEDDISYKVKSYEEYMNNLPEEDKPLYSILLIHEPDYIDKINVDNYDLILAGHSHGGQVKIPIITKWFLPDGSKKYYEKYYKVNNTDLYINSGIGTSKYKFRLFDKPSINFYRITQK